MAKESNTEESIATKLADGLNRFPEEFSELLSKSVRHRLAISSPDLSMAAGLSMFPRAIPAPLARFCHTLLDSSLAEFLQPLQRPTSADLTWGLRKNYSERLPKVMRQRTAYLNSRGRAASAARASGLTALLRSHSLRRFAEVVTGRRLVPQVGMQAICYGCGDYVGPHNDHHPEDRHLRSGYVDVHISFVNHAVLAQQVIYEGPDGHLNCIADAALNGSVAVYQLPFWHHVTPLRAKRGAEEAARRWVLMASYAYA